MLPIFYVIIIVILLACAAVQGWLLRQNKAARQDLLKYGEEVRASGTGDLTWPWRFNFTLRANERDSRGFVFNLIAIGFYVLAVTTYAISAAVGPIQ